MKVVKSLMFILFVLCGLSGKAQVTPQSSETWAFPSVIALSATLL